VHLPNGVQKYLSRVFYLDGIMKQIRFDGIENNLVWSGELSLRTGPASKLDLTLKLHQVDKSFG